MNESTTKKRYKITWQCLWSFFVCPPETSGASSLPNILAHTSPGTIGFYFNLKFSLRVKQSFWPTCVFLKRNEYTFTEF